MMRTSYDHIMIYALASEEHTWWW